RRRPDGDDRPHRRLDRVPLGAPDRQLRARRRSRPRAPPTVSGRLWLAGAAVFLAAALLTGALIGPVHIGLVEALESLGAKLPFLHIHTPLSPAQESILWDIRLPRVVLGALVGAMLAVAGASYQGVFRNPLADPYLLGVAAGAGLGATIAVVYLPNGFGFKNA